jgi:5-methylcytosine-specific restriction endonuclease McrA
MSRITDEVVKKAHKKYDCKCVYCNFDGKNPRDFRYLTIDHFVPKAKHL